MYRVTYLVIIVCIVFTSCKKDDNPSEEQADVENFYALKVGNTWTYNYFERVGTTDEFEDLNATDIVVITETSVVNGETYYTFQTTTTADNWAPPIPDEGVATEKIRDSLGYLINLEGDILYSNENLQDYLISSEAIGEIFGVLKEEMISITVEAGTFNSLENEVYLILQTGSTAPGKDGIFYSDGIGQIKRNFSSVSNPIHNWERRLTAFTLLE